MNPISWAKANKHSLVRSIVGSTKPPSSDSEPLAIFAAGIPGAGKTEFFDRLLRDTANIVRIDMDEIVKMFDGYTPENYYKYRGAANIIVDETVIYCRKNKLDFVLDGTFGSHQAVENVRSALKRHRVVIFYVWKEPSLAWQHTLDRQLVTKRGIEKEGFTDTCVSVAHNLRQVRKKFTHKVSIIAIKKDLTSDSFEMVHSAADIDALLEVKYTRDDIERTIS